MIKSIFAALLTGLLMLASPARAVSEDEIGKMGQAMPAAAVVEPSQPRTLLVFNLSNGFKHSSIPYWQKALEIMARKTQAFEVVNSSDMAIFNADSLNAFDAICFNNTTKLTPDAAQQKAILDFVRSGKGIVGIHAATDNFDEWPEGAMMMGGIFKGHPWTAGGTWAIKIDEPDHPLMKSFAGTGFKISDEIYRTLPPQYSRGSQRVLMSLDMSDTETRNAKGVTPDDMDTGISWIKPVGKGRLFYCSLGHNHHLTWTTPVLQHYLAGIQYAMGDLEADDTPLGEVSGSEVHELRALAQRVGTYQWDQSRAALAEMEQLIRETSSHPGKRKAIEAVVIDSLQSESTLPAKDFFCRTLSMIGTDASVPVLSHLLKDEATFDMARYALDMIPGDKAEAALLSAFESANNPRQIAALVTSLGKRKSSGSVATITQAAGGDDALVALAAVEALASIGGLEAVDSLQKIALSNGLLRQRAQDALLRCADTLTRSGQMQNARQLYKTLYAQENTPRVRAAALQGLAATNSPVREHVISALQADNAELHRAAVKIIAQSKDTTLLKQAVAAAESLPAMVQIQLVTALSENPLRIGRQTAEKLAGSSDKQVRLAAFGALSVLGSEESVLLLSSAAASGKDRDERLAARDALCRMAGREIDAKILAGIIDERLTEGARLELIEAAVQRQSKASTALVQAAGSSSPNIASQAIRALQSVGGADDVQALTQLVIERPGTDTENALTAAAQRIARTDARAAAILTYYDRVQNAQAKASLLRVMGKLADRHCVRLISTEYRSADPVISEAAFRAMTDWAGNDFAAQLKDAAKSATEVKTKVMAYRAYVRMLGTDWPALIEAYSFAPRSDEQKVLIGALAHCGSEQALAFVQTLSENDDLRTEAEMCMIGICEQLKNSNAARSAEVLRKLADRGSTDTVKKRASELLK